MNRFSRLVLTVCALLSGLVACTDSITPPSTKGAKPRFSLSNPEVTGTRTSTGFFYPTGRDRFAFTCGTWLGKAINFGGCYFKDYYHIGYDIMESYGSPVYAISSGEVISRSDDAGSWGTGNSALYIKHTLSDGTQFVALYGHIHTSLNNGNRVSGGVEIGTIGDWGDGDHLHFGVRPGPDKPPAPTGMMSHLTNTYPASNGFVDPIGWINTRTPKCQNGTAERYRPWGAIPVHPNGSLIQVAGDYTIFVLQNGIRRAISSPQVLWTLYGAGRGFDFRDVITVSPEEMSAYPRGADVTSSLPGNGRSEPDGRIIQQAGSPEISLVTNNGTRRPFASLKAFLALGYTFCNVAYVSDYYSYPTGSAITQ
jgi:hypothetical protein